MMQDTSTTARESIFHAEDVEEVVGYRSISPLAIIGLIFGLASPLCITWPLLTIIPLLGALVSIIAIRQIAASEGLLGGRGAAALGLALSVLFAVAALSRDYGTQFLRTWQAERFGREWLETLVSGDVDKAFRMTIEGARPTLPPPPEPTAPPEEQIKPIDAFRNQQLVKDVLACAADSQVMLLETVGFERRPYQQFIVRQRYRITPTAAAPAGGEAAKPVELILEMQRTRFQGDVGSRWFVEKVEPPTGSAT